MWLLILTIYSVLDNTQSSINQITMETIRVEDLTSYEECVRIHDNYRAKNQTYTVDDTTVKIKVTFSCTQLKG